PRRGRHRRALGALVTHLIRAVERGATIGSPRVAKNSSGLMAEGHALEPLRACRTRPASVPRPSRGGPRRDVKRTRTTSLEGWSSAIELRPHGFGASLATSEQRSGERRRNRRKDNDEQE